MVKKRFLPSKKEKRRYLAFEIISEDEINFKEVAVALSNSLIESLGYEAHIRLLTDKWNQESQRGIIRVNNRYLNDSLDMSISFDLESTYSKENVGSMAVCTKTMMLINAKTIALATENTPTA